MTTPADHVNRLVGTLAALGESELAVLTKPLVPGVYFSIDPAAQIETLHVTTGKNQILTAELKSSRPGRWVTLNFDIGAGSLADRKLLGLAIRLVAMQTMPLRAAVRTHTKMGSVDTPFDRFGLIGPGVATRAGVLWIDDAPALAKPATWRTLILFFDPAGFRFSLLDLHMFH